MAKFHVNNAGEAGQCRATQGGCPFGGDAQHYESPEVAREAFELSMAGSQVPEVSKKTSSTDRTAAVADAIRGEYAPSNYGGLEKKDVVFDKDAVLQKYRNFYMQKAKISNLKMDGVEEAAYGSMLNEKKSWEIAARTAPAKSYEQDVPIRLLPVGAEVNVGKWNGSRIYKTVGVPVDNGDGHIVGKYRDVANEWDYVEPETTFNLAIVPLNKSVSPRWTAANAKAAEISKQRAQYQQDLIEAAEMEKSKSKKN